MTDVIKPLTYGSPAVYLSKDQEVELFIESSNGHSYRLELDVAEKQGWITVTTFDCGSYDRRIEIRNSKVQLYINPKKTD